MPAPTAAPAVRVALPEARAVPAAVVRVVPVAVARALAAPVVAVPADRPAPEVTGRAADSANPAVAATARASPKARPTSTERKRAH